MSSGIPGLDEMLNGGYLPGSVVLVRGAPGTGKTTLGLQFLRAGAAQNEPGLFISFEEFPESLERDAASLGWDLKAMQAGGALTVQFTSPEVLLASLQSGDSPLQQLIHENNVRRLVLDSATHFTRLARDEQDLRQTYSALVNALKREDLTALLLAEDRRRVAGG
ncbi:MAG: AAA family ATPase, partial [Chloroflexi bacterium]|nr:AAA family ATPase [Chloroflexota bacterium]